MTKPLTFPFSFQVVLLGFLLFFSGVHIAPLFLEGQCWLGSIRSGRDRKDLSLKGGIAVRLMLLLLVSRLAARQCLSLQGYGPVSSGKEDAGRSLFPSCSSAFFPVSISV
jgi:hypothetical protein